MKIRNKENTEIRIDGIRVNNEKYVIYFLFDVNPSLSISFLIEFLISIKININSKTIKIYLKLINIVNYFDLIR